VKTSQHETSRQIVQLWHWQNPKFRDTSLDTDISTALAWYYDRNVPGKFDKASPGLCAHSKEAQMSIKGHVE